MDTVLGVSFGLLLVAVGLVGVAGTPAMLDRAGRAWPRRYTAGDAHSFYSAGFLLRFSGLLALVAGIGILALTLT